MAAEITEDGDSSAANEPSARARLADSPTRSWPLAAARPPGSSGSAGLSRCLWQDRESCSGRVGCRARRTSTPRGGWGWPGGRPGQMMASWRSRADAFPRELVSALVEQALAPEVLTGWSAREALVSRGDSLAVRDLLTRTGLAAVRVILALNRVYLPHRQLKWQRHLTAGLGLVPDRLTERLESLSTGRPVEALQTAEALLAEIVALAETHCDADIGAFRQALSERRQAIGPPQPGP